MSCRGTAFLSKAANAEGSLERTTTYGALRRCGVPALRASSLTTLARVSPVFAATRLADPRVPRGPHKNGGG